MPGTFQALFVLLIAVLPGGLYTWYFEREVGAWGAKAVDRVLRLIGSSALFLALFAYPAYLIWSNYLHRRAVVNGKVVFQDLISRGEPVPWYLFAVPVAYVLIPVLLGWLSGRSVIKTRQGSGGAWEIVAALTAGRDPAPRAWDFVFLSHPAAVVRIRLRDDAGWIGGLFGADSYASGYDEEPQDLFLEKAYAMEADGEFTAGQDPGGFEELGSSVLLAFDTIEHIEFFEE